MPKEFQPHFDRFVGSDDEEVLRKAQRFQDGYGDQMTEDLRQYDVELSEEQERLVAETQQKVDTILESYDVKPISIPRDHVHMVSRETLGAVTGDEKLDGSHQSVAQQVLIGQGQSNIGFAHTLAHEMFHAKAYHVGKLLTRTDGRFRGIALTPYRSGVSLRIKEGDDYSNYFGQINEAVTEELTNQIYEDYLRKDPDFKQDIENTDIIKQFLLEGGISGIINPDEYVLDIIAIAHPEKIVAIIRSPIAYEKKHDFVAHAIKQEEQEGGVTWSGYPEWQRLLENYMEGVQQDSRGIYATPHEVFKDFVKAQFSGNYLTLARNLEKIYGKGEFCRLANASKMENKDMGDDTSDKK